MLASAPPETWLLALQYVCDIMNHTAEKSLGNRPPLQILEGRTIDISILLFFLFWDIVYVSRVEDHEYHGQIGSRKSSLVRGRMVGFAWNVGHSLTYKVLTDDTRRIICRSRLRLAPDAENQIEEARRMQPRPERFFLDSKHSFDDPSTKLPTLEAFDCPFIDNDDDQLDPTSVSDTDRGATPEENRGANSSTDRGVIPIVETADAYDTRDGALRPGFTSAETSSRSIIDDHRIAKICPHGTKIERRFNNGLWYPGTVLSGPYQFADSGGHDHEEDVQPLERRQRGHALAETGRVNGDTGSSQTARNGEQGGDAHQQDADEAQSLSPPGISIHCKLLFKKRP